MSCDDILSLICDHLNGLMGDSDCKKVLASGIPWTHEPFRDRDKHWIVTRETVEGEYITTTGIITGVSRLISSAFGSPVACIKSRYNTDEGSNYELIGFFVESSAGSSENNNQIDKHKIVKKIKGVLKHYCDIQSGLEDFINAERELLLTPYLRQFQHMLFSGSQGSNINSLIVEQKLESEDRDTAARSSGISVGSIINGICKIFLMFTE